MKSYITTYNGLFARHGEGARVVKRIEIPVIQRDYAQGRESVSVGRIRANFLDVLHGALTAGPPISLDFVYGDVVDGTLRPLDGQQRLTTLFLLHWYIAWRANRLDEHQGWKMFEYATRQSAARFCKRLVDSSPPSDAKLRSWFEDQHWFLHTWQHDPTIQAMLVMIESIHRRFVGADAASAWSRLTDIEAPAISFHLLPIEQMGLSEDLYIKMNSRGKPLTPFENFKARFEQVIEQSCPDRTDEFAQKVDGPWADLLWPLRGADDIVDDEFLRYFTFVTEICSWQDGEQPTGDVEALAERVYGPGNNKATAHLEFLIRAFDVWVDVDTDAVFSEIFSLTPAALDSEDVTRVVLFGSQASKVNLFADCCDRYFRRSWPRTLLLYAVLLHRLHETDDFSSRLRIVRNLVEASNSELRAERIPALLGEVRRIVTGGSLEKVSTFNQSQVADERLKASLRNKSPGIKQHMVHLEDHPMLRGCLNAFELDNDVFERRARAFHDLFADSTPLSAITGALLAAGDYSQAINFRFVRLGSGTERSQWREHFLSGSSRTNLTAVREALAIVLDAIASRVGDVGTELESFRNEWLGRHDASTGLDWRWYFVRYDEMRAGRSGIYACTGGALGYQVCMLDKKAVSSFYRDPYLSAIRAESSVAEGAVQGPVAQHWAGGPWFTGYETEARWLRLRTSGTGMQSVRDGIALLAPVDAKHAQAFARVCAEHGVQADLSLKIPQVTVGGRELDSEDRVKLGAALLRDLVNAGL